MSIPVPQTTYVVKSLHSVGGGFLSIGGNPAFLEPGGIATLTVDVGSANEAIILKLISVGKLSQVSNTPVFTPMSGYTQSILPVITDEQSIVGIITLDAPTAFVGSETSVVVSTKTVAVRRVQYLRRGSVPVTVDFMAASLSRAQDVDGLHRRLPTFQEVSSITPQDTWKATGGSVISPGYGAKSLLQHLLTRSSY